MTTLVEAVPNVSEGRRPEVILALADAVRHVTAVDLLDVSADASHNRVVLTLVGEPDPVVEALLAVYSVALDRIDLRTHRGVHPRVGAVDVVPFVPIEGVTMMDCVALAQRLGRLVSERFSVPVYLYGAAASRADRRALENIRRGGFGGLTRRMATAPWRPDFGPPRPHPTAGASVIGARGPLIAFNVNLDSNDLDVAREIARAVRERDGGLPGVKALGLQLDDPGIVQVSMNLTDYTRTGLFEAFARIHAEAARRGVRVRESEIVGLVPADALVDAGRRAVQLDPLKPSPVLEARLSDARRHQPAPPGETT